MSTNGYSLDTIEETLIKKNEKLEIIIKETALNLEQFFIDDKNLVMDNKDNNLNKITRIINKLTRFKEKKKTK